MKTYQIQIRNGIKTKIKLIKDFIVNKTNREHAILYTAELYTEIENLKYLANFIKISELKTGKKYNKKEKFLFQKQKMEYLLPCLEKICDC